MPTKCSIDNCNVIAKSKGLCGTHYQMWWRNGRTTKIYNGDKRSHPLYIIWWQRKKDNLLSIEWLDFWEFVKNVSPKPNGNFFLVRIEKGLFGPNNFKWQEHLKKKDGESNRNWWARKRAARIVNSPSMESDRNIKRVYGLTREQYNNTLWLQDGSCAICKGKETTADAKTGTTRRLAVDHCHNTKIIRGLLCWRCNATLGKVEDSIELLQSMINYLLKHKEC